MYNFFYLKHIIMLLKLDIRTFLSVDLFTGRHSLWTFGDVKKTLLKLPITGFLF